MTDGQRTFPPPCPICSGATALKELHRTRNPDGYACFFFCNSCGIEYPQFADADFAQVADLHTMLRTGRRKPDGMPGA